VVPVAPVPEPVVLSSSSPHAEMTALIIGIDSPMIVPRRTN
jgi:hypothetical protein